jgi:cellulose synthase/poly-beta-1,6-N-acetylglucosamine synthase-like glycosyltransferase
MIEKESLERFQERDQDQHGWERRLARQRLRRAPVADHQIRLPAKDAWGAAFYCGTSAVFRVAALLATEGMATETVTEDMLTSFKMEESWLGLFEQPVGCG